MSSRLTCLLTVLLLAYLAMGGLRIANPDDGENITLKRLQLGPPDSGVRRMGDLVLLGAWELRSRNQNFGGISALTALSDGRFVGVSDAGSLIGFGLINDERIDRPFISPLPDSQGFNLTYKDRDSEGITRDHASGQFWVSYEAHHAIRRFSRSFSRSTGIVRLSGKFPWPNNKGVEAITRLYDGRFVTIAENLEEGRHEGFIFSGDPIESGSIRMDFSYQPPSGYRVTDAAQLPNGQLLILNRRVWLPTGFTSKIAIVDPETMADGALVKGRVIATIAAPLPVDNMEGIAVSEIGGETFVWLISDDNFSIFQRTLLMKFRFAERSANKIPEAATAPGFESL